MTVPVCDPATGNPLQPLVLVFGSLRSRPKFEGLRFSWPDWAGETRVGRRTCHSQQTLQSTAMVLGGREGEWNPTVLYAPLSRGPRSLLLFSSIESPGWGQIPEECYQAMFHHQPACDASESPVATRVMFHEVLCLFPGTKGQGQRATCRVTSIVTLGSRCV